MITKIQSEENFKQILEKNRVILAKFSADWCGPCKMLAPVIEEIAKELKDKIMIIDIDVDINSDLASKFKITSIPTMILFVDKKQIEVKMGILSKESIIKWIQNNS